MTYKVKFNINGGLKGMPYLEIDDVVVVVNAKNKTAKVKEIWNYNNEPMYNLEGFGLVRATELERVK